MFAGLPPSSSDLTERKSVVPPSPPADRRRISKFATLVVARSSSGTYEDAKRVPCGIRVDKQWLDLVIRSVPEEAGAESQCTLMLDLQVAQGTVVSRCSICGRGPSGHVA